MRQGAYFIPHTQPHTSEINNADSARNKSKRSQRHTSKYTHKEDFWEHWVIYTLINDK